MKIISLSDKIILDCLPDTSYIWEHIHEIEKGPFYPIEEVHQRIRSWMDNYQGKK